VVKVLRSCAGFALYFSRAPIPYRRNDRVDPRGDKPGRPPKRRLWGYRHLGLYVFRRDFLFRFARLRPTALEQIESLEQLRALQNGYPIYVAEVDEPSIEVDTVADLREAKRYLQSGLNERKLWRR
jgi:3-deoxy-manno-octulosonate cytidylyltransferase (CMP-KDO synthetase)